MTSFRQPGTVLTDRTFGVPLDHGRPDGEQIELFAREIVATEKVDVPGLTATADDVYRKTYPQVVRKNGTA